MAYKVDVQKSICYDFLSCIARFSNNDRYMPSEKHNQDIYNWYENSKDLVPNSIKKQMDLFFNADTAFGMMLTSFISENEVEEIDDLISIIEDTPADIILAKFLSSGIERKKDLDEDLISKVIKGEANAIDYINTKTIFSDEDKWQVLQFIMNQEKMKSDVVELLIWFNENLYSEVVNENRARVAQYSKDLEERIDRYGDEYVKLLLPYDVAQKEYDVITLAISYYLEKSRMLNIADGVFVYGYRYFDSIEGEHSILSGKQLFKALADETRLNIIRLLSKRAWYGNEIAERLNISNSTVTHHMATLILNNIVSSYRQEYRIYFELDKDRLKKVVNSTLESIIE